jgi:hypothetical protein
MCVQDTVVNKPGAKETPNITSSNSKTDSNLAVSTIATTVYTSSRETGPQEYSGGATHTTEIDTAIEKYVMDY